MKRILNTLRDQRFTNAFVVLLLFLFFSVATTAFFSFENFSDLLKSYAVLGILACGMLPIIISGGIDVSIGATISACACVMALFMKNVSSSIFLALVVSCLTGVALGAINGILISRLNIQPLIVTLGTCSIINGFMIYLTNGSWITGLPENLVAFGRLRPLGIPVQTIFFAGVALLTWFLLRYTLWGRGVYAIGGDETSATRVGFRPATIKLLLYCYMGFLAGLAAVVHTSIMSQVDPNAFKGYEMTVISAVVLGGVNISGGFGGVFGVIVGVLFLGITYNGLVLLKVSSYWQSIIVGAIMLLAIAVDTLRKTREARSKTVVDVEYTPAEEAGREELAEK